MDEQKRTDAQLENPYHQPQSTLLPSETRLPRWGRIACRLICILIAVYCMGQFALNVLVAYRFLSLTGAGMVPLVNLLELVITPLVLAIAGLLLACGRRMSVFVFIAYLCLRVADYGVYSIFLSPPLAVVLAFLSFAVLLWLGGALSGWPRRRRS